MTVENDTFLDRELPYLIEDMSDEQAFTGETFDLVLNAWDNIGVEKVEAIYCFDPNNWSDIGLENCGGLWYGVIDVPISPPFSFSNGRTNMTLDYSIIIRDMSGNMMEYGNNTVEVIDSIPPTIVDITEKDFTTGEPMRFSVRATDNIWIDGLWLYCEFYHDITDYLWQMEYSSCRRINLKQGHEMIEVSPGLYEATITAPSNGCLAAYHFFIHDTYNFNKTMVQLVDVIDDDPPEIIDIFEERTAFIGRPLDIWIEATDDIKLVEAEYLSHSWNGSIYLTADGRDTFKGRVPVPINSTDPFGVRIIVEDSQHRKDETEWIVIEVRDDIPPEIEPMSDLNLTCGDLLDFTVRATDNVGIRDYSWNGSPIDPDGPRLRGKVRKEGSYHIEVTVADSAGNRINGSFHLTVVKNSTVDEDATMHVYRSSSISFVIPLIIKGILIGMLLFLILRKKEGSMENSNERCDEDLIPS